MRGKREGTWGHTGMNVWVYTPGRVFKRVLREWGHGCQVWLEPLLHSASVSLVCRGRMEEASEPDSLSVGMGQVSTLWASFLPRRDRVWAKQRLLHFPEKKVDHLRS